MSSTNGVKAADRPESAVCNVGECSAWKTGDLDFCHHHQGMAKGNAGEGNQRAMKSGIHSDPVNLFNWLSENEPDALAYILSKLHDYAERAPEKVFIADVTDAESFEDVETKLTSYGDDLLFMCIRDYARWRGQMQQLKEGLTTEQVRQGDHGTYTVEDSNPVNLDLDRMDKTVMRQKDKLGLMPSPESEKAEAERELAQVARDALED